MLRSLFKCVPSVCAVSLLLGTIAAASQHPEVSPDPTQAPPGEEPAKTPLFSLSVDLVLLYVSVEDRNGEFVGGIPKTNFQVLEDGVLQQMEFFHEGDVPITAGLIVDKSGSIRPAYKNVVTAALIFVRLRNPHDQLFVVNFNDHPWLGSGGEYQFTNDITRLQTALLRSRPQGKTALYDALTVGLEHLELGSHPKKALLLISDGGDNSSTHSFGEVLDLAHRSDAIIYAIGLYDKSNPERDPDVLKRLAKETGGQAFFPQSAERLPDVCGRIADDLRRQYIVGYSPSAAHPAGGFRKIEVRVRGSKRKDLTVRTRAGYFAPVSSDTTPETFQKETGKP